MAIIVHCPKCSIKLTLGDDRTGEELDCPKCGRRLRVPVATLPAPSPSRPLPPPLPVPSDPEGENELGDAPSSPSHQRRGVGRSTRRPVLWLAVAVLALVGVILLGTLALRRSGSGGVRYSPETVELREMGQPNLTKLVTDLHALPEVNSIAAAEDGEGAGMASVFLPPDRSYDTATLIVALKGGAGGSSEGFVLGIIDCTSPDRAELLVERAKVAATKDVRFRSSGQFAVYGSDEGIRWLGRHYHLRGSDPPVRPKAPEPPPKFVPKGTVPKLLPLTPTGGRP